MEFLQDGRTRIDCGDGGDILELKLPNYGQFKEWRLRSVDIGEESIRLAEEAAQLPEGSDERREAFRAADEKAEVMIAGFWRDVAAQLGNRTLPDDIATWPIELVVGRKINPLLAHWKADPLDRGAQGQPIL